MRASAHNLLLARKRRRRLVILTEDAVAARLHPHTGQVAPASQRPPRFTMSRTTNRTN